MGGDLDSTGERPERVRGDGCRQPPNAWSARDDVCSHLYRFSRKVVRDLAWAMSSPHVVGDPDTERHETETKTSEDGDKTSDAGEKTSAPRRPTCHPRVFPDEDAKRLLEDSSTWLDALDADPSHVLDWIKSQRGSNKLGFYFGALVEYGVRFNPTIGAEAVTVHRQVAKSLGAGRMVGQLKLVFRSRGERGETKITHWEYNVKYFVDAGCCFGDEAPIVSKENNGRNDETGSIYEPEPSLSDRAYVACAFESRVDREMEDLRDYKTRGSMAPPAGDSCYVGPFLHENLYIRVREASRKLALAEHKNVASWLDRWASGELEGESVELTELGKRRQKSAEGWLKKKPPPFEKVSQQILRGYLFYPLRGDGRGGSATWRDARARGTASDAHLRGWWVRTPEELLDVKTANEKLILVANDETTQRNDGHSDDDGSGSDDGSDGDGRMWALFTRKCHWLGPCVATHVPEARLRDGADTQWIVRGVPELNIKDVEVFPTSQVVDAARKVLKISDRGVLVAELVKYSETNETSDSSRHDTTFTWREISRGFVLPPNWDPWPTALRVDPFRRRYERQIKTAENTEKRIAKDGDDDDDAYDERFGKMHITPENHIEDTSSSHETEVVFDEMYPDREDVEALGDDVRVRDWGSRDERRRRDASATFAAFETRETTSDVNVNGDDTFRNGTSDVTIGVPSPRPGAVAGASFTDAARNATASVSEKTHALLSAVKNALDLEGSVVRPARPSLVRALAAVGGVEDAVSPETASPNIDGFSGSSARDAETRSTRVLVESAVRGAAACLAALGDVDDKSAFEDETAKRSDTDGKICARTKTRRFSMSTRRAVSHAILDALGPATRRNGCVGDAFAPHAAKVFETCLKGFIRRGTCEDEDEDSEKQERSFSEDPSDTQSVGTNLTFSGVCPRVAVRFAKILRVSPTLASPFPGAATRMAEALSLAAVADTKKESRSEREGEGVANENENENDSSRRLDAPASRAGAVAELLAWSGESASVPEALFVSLSALCVDAGHASAAEVLLKTRSDDAHALRARLARTHADAGNHRAARRLAGESLLDELRRDAEEPFAFLPVSPNRVSLDEGVSSETTFSKGVLASALGDSNASIVLAHDLHSVSRARALLESAFSARLSDPRRDPSDRRPTPIVGFDCEWRPGPGDASSNPVTVAQFAMHTGVGLNGHAVVVLDCAPVFGPNASFELASAATSFVKTVFETCLLCGFGVASDARRLAASYPDRFFSVSFGSSGSKQAHEENITATTVCVRDVSITLGASAQTHASSLSNLCASVLGPNDALDKTEQTSGWDARPLRPSQILYAALDALAPRCVLVTLLAKRAKRMFEGDVADACVPWTKKETLGAAFLQTLKEKTSASDGACGDFFSSTPPRTDADVRRALTRLGALTRSDEILADADADADADAAECLVMVEGWSTSSLKRTTLLCKTLAVVAESTSDGNVFLAATCVLPARDSIRLDLAAAAEALLGVDVSSPTPAFRLRLANANELHELFGFAAGSVGPFGLRDSVKSLRRLTVMDESLFVGDDVKKRMKLSCGSSLVAVGGGAPDVKVVGTAQAVAKHADASVARLTARNL